MAKLQIIIAPDPRLKVKCRPVARVDAEIRQLMDDMLETMYAAPGIGLAATQVDVHKRVIVMDISDTRDQLRVFIDPVILSAEGEADNEEGCLSVPGYYDKVTRAARIRVRSRSISRLRVSASTVSRAASRSTRRAARTVDISRAISGRHATVSWKSALSIR